MTRQDILNGLKLGMQKGETLEKAMMNLYYAGYPKEDIEEAAKEILMAQNPVNQQTQNNSHQKNTTTQNKPSTSPNTIQNAQQQNQNQQNIQPKPIQQNPIQTNQPLQNKSQNQTTSINAKPLPTTSAQPIPQQNSTQKISQYGGEQKKSSTGKIILIIVIVLLILLVLGAGAVIIFREAIGSFLFEKFGLAFLNKL